MIQGDNAKNQLPRLHELMVSSKGNANKSILWASKAKLTFAGNSDGKKKRKTDERAGADKPVDPFKQFVNQQDIRFVLYKETEKVLGNTYGMCVLQDFEAMTPNVLARTIETVEGGGIVVMLLNSKTSLQELHTLEMDVHSRYKTEAYDNVFGRFNKRFALSLAACESCVVVDDNLNVLHAGILAKPDESMQLHLDMSPDPFLELAKTTDQAKAISAFANAISKKTLKSTVTLTAGRGRGKSAALGLSIASAVSAGYSNIFVTSPSPENLKTLFEFIVKGLKILGYTEKADYEKIQSTNPAFNRATVRVNIFKNHRQSIQYIQPSDSKLLAQAELVVIDEAAAIPLPLVKKLMGQYLIFMASTINGYEGTGRSLSLKLIHELREQRHVKKSHKNYGRTLTELSLVEPIRYSLGDPVEAWLNRLLCLDATEDPLTAPFPDATDCTLFSIDRDVLFSFAAESEEFLNKVMALYVASHYKNSPNDLQLLSDAPAHELYVLAAPYLGGSTYPEPLCVVQLALEGGISKSTVVSTLSRGSRASGDMIPWLVSQQFQDNDFPALLGARVVRIATHSSCMSKGYGVRALEQLQTHFSSSGDIQLQQPATDNFKVDPGEPTLLTDISNKTSPGLNYLGVSYGLTPQLNRFWKKAGFAPCYLRQTPNELTGEFTCVMLKALDHSTRVAEFAADFRHRFMSLLSYAFQAFTTVQALSIMEGAQRALKGKQFEHKKLTRAEVSAKLSNLEMDLLLSYSNSLLDYSVITHMLPTISEWYLDGRFPAKMVLTPVQTAILLGTGLQRKDIDVVAREFDLPLNLILSIFEKTIRQISLSLHEI